MTKVLLLLSLLSLPLLAAEILVISSYHQSNQWDQSYSAGLEQHLKQAHHLGYLYLDTKRQPGQTRDELLAKGMAAYRTHQPALVILGDDNAINYLAGEIAALGTPVVFLGMNENPRHKGLVGHPMITGVLERPLLKRNISEMSQLMGGIKKALVLFDSSQVSLTAIEDEFKIQTELRVGQTLINSQLIGDYGLWQEAVLHAKQNGYQAIFIGLYHTLTDAQGQHVSEQQVLAWTSANSPVPLFCFWEFSVGQGRAIGGLVLDGRDQGARAAELIGAILAGAQPGTLAPRAALRGEYVFSESQLARWRLTLPDKWRYKTLWRE
ncbi:ABC transporter substrate-binding protein [Aeromonas caviae]|uniref:ABC transporter substrate-binding protein n=1 Tax=Aeromonas caviae TaxID=648 RepID=UPI0038D1B7E8